MKINERIANKIIEHVEESVGVEINGEAYYNLEHEIARIIDGELINWLNYDTDMRKVEK